MVVVHFIDVGQGNMTLAEMPDGTIFLSVGREAAADDGAFFVIDGLGVTGIPEPRYSG